MISKSFKQEFQKLLFFLFSILFLLASSTAAEDNFSEKHNKVVMRKIGHEVLKCLGDESSRVLPIQKVKQSYLISFEVDLSFDPDDIVPTIDQVIKESQIANHYFVEVLQCETQLIMHSYEIKHTRSPYQIACTGRILPSDCYHLQITLVDNKAIIENSTTSSAYDSSTDLSGRLVLIFIGLIVLASFLWRGKKVFFSKEKQLAKSQDLISIGSLQFDQTNMLLYSDKTKINLTHKETELLALLHEFANSTVKRELILKRVWGDSGDYVGRTLDVFISKLRKKIDVESKIKILNVRGVGYRLVLNNDSV